MDGQFRGFNPFQQMNTQSGLNNFAAPGGAGAAQPAAGGSSPQGKGGGQLGQFAKNWQGAAQGMGGFPQGGGQGHMGQFGNMQIPQGMSPQPGGFQGFIPGQGQMPPAMSAQPAPAPPGNPGIVPPAMSGQPMVGAIQNAMGAAVMPNTQQSQIGALQNAVGAAVMPNEQQGQLGALQGALGNMGGSMPVMSNQRMQMPALPQVQGNPMATQIGKMPPSFRNLRGQG